VTASSSPRAHLARLLSRARVCNAMSLRKVGRLWAAAGEILRAARVRARARVEEVNDGRGRGKVRAGEEEREGQKAKVALEDALIARETCDFQMRARPPRQLAVAGVRLRRDPAVLRDVPGAHFTPAFGRASLPLLPVFPVVKTLYSASQRLIVFLSALFPDRGKK